MKINQHKIKFLFFNLLLVFLIGCTQYEPIYEVNELDLQSESARKNKLKSNDQYVSILYANLFQKALPASELAEINRLLESIGDKGTAKEIIISNMMNQPNIIMPSETEMRANIDQFIIDTFKRFYIRKPTASEKAYFKNTITTRTNLTVEMIYTAFALSDEYQYY